VLGEARDEKLLRWHLAKRPGQATVQDMARPRLELNAQVVRGMARVGSSNVEIANFVGCDEATIRNRFSEILAKERAGLRVRLRKAQLRQARKGNVTMLIFLGKAMLGQSDKGPIEPGLTTTERSEPVYDYSQLTVEELETMEHLLTKAQRA
jgi:hypothetical protein